MQIFFRRGAAFCIDYMIITFMWGAIDNLLYFPIPNMFSYLAPLVLFCVYFAVFEAGPTGASSPGKRIVRLTVVKDDGGHLSRKDTLDRSIIVGIITFVDWYSLRLAFPGLPVPGFLLIVLIAAQISVMIYNAWLCRLPFDYLMLQDRWTKTRVVRATQLGSLSSQIGQHASISTASHYVGLSVLFAVTLTGGLWIGKLTDQNLWGTSHSGNELTWRIKNAFEQQFGVRVRPTVTQRHTISTNEPRVRTTLIVSIWVPYTGWNLAQMDNFLNTALDNVSVEPGYFDSGQITLETGIGLLSTARTYELNLPQPLTD